MPEQTHDIDSILLREMNAGSEQAFEQIFRKYWYSLYKVAASKLQSHEEAQEVVQNIFSSLWEKKGSLAIENLAHYLLVSVRNGVLNVIRRRVSEERHLRFYKSYLPAANNLTDDDVEYNELNDVLETALEKLQGKSREVFRLSRFEGKSNHEIAAIMKLSTKAIEYHLTRSIREIRLHLKDYTLMLAAALLLIF